MEKKNSKINIARLMVLLFVTTSVILIFLELGANLIQDITDTQNQNIIYQVVITQEYRTPSPEEVLSSPTALPNGNMQPLTPTPTLDIKYTPSTW